MSKHSKNNTNSSVFTYMQRQKLKNQYGTHNSRIGQDSIKTFKMCTLCHNFLIQPTACSQGHIFCRGCVVEYLVKQKKKIAENKAEIEMFQMKKEKNKMQEVLKQEVKKIEEFQKYETFQTIIGRSKFSNPEKDQGKKQVPTVQVKPVGIYELNPQKQSFTNTAFWTLQNTPVNIDHVEKQTKIVKCPGGNHKLTLKKLKNLLIKEVQKQFYCWICSKEIQRQKVGTYKCGHVVCHICKSNRCEMCTQKDGWMILESGASSYAAHNKAEVKTYTHAFIG